MHPTVGNLVVLNTLDASSELLFGLMQVQPSPARKMVLDTFVKTLKSAGIWQKLDLLYVLAAHDAQAARLNWIAPQANALVATNSPVFTVDQGYAGDGVAASLTAQGYNPSTAAAKLTLNDASMGMYQRTPAAGGLVLYTNNGRISHQTTPNIQARVNSGGSGSATPGSYAGLFVARRTAADAMALFQDGVSLYTNSTASTSVATSFVLFGITANFSAAQLSLAFAGSSLNDTQMAAMNTAISTLKTGIGF